MMDAEQVLETIFEENFDGDLSKWNQDDLIVSSEHRTHSSYLDPITGAIDFNQPWHKIPGRHAALYDDYRDECQYIEDGKLVMRGVAIERPARFRDNYTDAQDSTLIHRYGDFELYGGWLSTKDRFHPGCVIEVKINLEEQCMRAHRFSIWLVATNGKMYQQTVEFCEIDLLEAEDAPRVENYPFSQTGLIKIVGGDAGDTPGGQVDFSRDNLKINIRKGWHNIALVWNKNGSLEFYCDGKLCVTDDRTLQTPPDGVQMEAQLILSDEMTSGVKGVDAGSWQNRSTGPKVPKDDGLFGHSVILDVDLMDDHKVYVDWVKVYKIPEVDEPENPKLGEMEALIARHAKEIEDLQQTIDEQDDIIDKLAGEITKTRDAVATLLNL